MSEQEAIRGRLLFLIRGGSSDDEVDIFLRDYDVKPKEDVVVNPRTGYTHTVEKGTFPEALDDQLSNHEFFGKRLTNRELRDGHCILNHNSKVSIQVDETPCPQQPAPDDLAELIRDVCLICHTHPADGISDWIDPTDAKRIAAAIREKYWCEKKIEGGIPTNSGIMIVELSGKIARLERELDEANRKLKSVFEFCQTEIR